MIMNNKQVISEIRKEAKNAGLTFKVDNRLTINGSTAYKFCVRNSDKVVLSNCTLGSAYNNVCSGFIASWNGEKFEGVNNYA